MSLKKYELFSIDDYSKKNEKFIKNNGIEIDNIEDVINYLKSDRGYHIRVHNNTQYIFFGDLDNYKNGITKFINYLQVFMKKKYGLEFTLEEFKYTQNNENEHSFHYSIPKWNLSTEKLKEIHELFIKEHSNEFIYKKNKINKTCIDTSIYSEHWFRLPNQKKGTNIDDTSKHIIINGCMKDFIVEYIPKNSININDIEEIIEVKQEEKIVIKKEKKKDELIVYSEETNKEKILSATLTQPIIYKQMFDGCYKQERFDCYEYWMSVGMALKNTFPNEDEAFELFNYFSAKGNNYDGLEKTQTKFKTFVTMKSLKKKYTAATLYYYAIEDNKPVFIKIIDNNTPDFEQFDMCKYAKILGQNRFIYIVKNNIYKFYSFNGHTWKNDDTLFKEFLSNDLYDFLKKITFELYYEHKNYNSMQTQIKKLKLTKFKKEIVESYKEVNSRDDIKLDDKWYLFGFENIVYDFNEEQFREYKYDDFISITTGYNWQEPTEEELQVVNDLIKRIMPDEEERNLYLQILSTCLDGRCLERFIIFNGNGRNGKGMMNDLLLCALGNYGMICNNNLLFEASKTGSNPEKANIHKKRLVIFREPPENKKFENSVVKELTGGGLFSARGHHESETQKELNLTMIVECNKKPLFAEEPTIADAQRIIDIYFKSTFTNDEKLIDENDNVFLANPDYKTKEFQEQHKYALIKILLEEHKKYKQNKWLLVLPKSVNDRTQNYLEMSYNIVQWFKDSFELTNKKEDIIKIKDLYDDFTKSNYFFNLGKIEKKKYNKTYFNNFIETNIFFKQYFIERTSNMRHFLCKWIKKQDCN